MNQKAQIKYLTDNNLILNERHSNLEKIVTDLKSEKEEELREAMRNSESPIIAILPRKKDIDVALNTFIVSDIEEEP